jgi:hypothetical protein
LKDPVFDTETELEQNERNQNARWRSAGVRPLPEQRAKTRTPERRRSDKTDTEKHRILVWGHLGGEATVSSQSQTDGTINLASRGRLLQHSA